MSQRGDVRRLKAIVTVGFQHVEKSVEISAGQKVRVLSWDELLTEGKSVADVQLETSVEKVRPGHCAALIYTSGTTGDPKAVMISHDSMTWESFVVLDMLEKSVKFGKQPERILSYLPLSHVAGMLVDIVSPVVGTATKDSFCTLYYARAYDLKAGSIKDRLAAARPTLFLGVPLVWEKIADKIKEVGAKSTGCRKTLTDWAKSTASKRSESLQLHNQTTTPCCFCVADLLMKMVKKNIGLQECRFGLTGAAPIRQDTLEYYGSLSLQINEVYGMSECAGACTVSLLQQHQWGSCGFELPAVEVKAFSDKMIEMPKSPNLTTLDEKYQGEICFRGRNNMMGYLACNDMGPKHVAEIQQKTREAIDENGWLRSGDKGMITMQGMVKITGRYKELIIGDGGENIAPVPIEDFVKKMCDGINEVMMVGDHKKYNVALVTLKAVGANGEVPGSDSLDAGAKRVNPDVATISAAMKDKKWIDTVTAAIAGANSNGKICPNQGFKIQKFTILPHNFSEEKNELTPTKKLKRKVVETIYKDVIDKMYQTSGVYISF